MTRLMFVLTCIVVGATAMSGAAALEWEELPPLPDGGIGVAGPFAGVSDGALIVAGGANFPDGYPWDDGTKVWYPDVYVLEEAGDEETGALAWRTGFALERPLAYGGSVTTDDGVVCLGGCDADRCYADVFLLRWDKTARQVERSPLPSLPAPCAFTYATRIGDVVYVAGGQDTMEDARAMTNFWALDLAADTPRWDVLPPWPGPARVLPVLAAQNDGATDCVYLFSGRYIAPDEPTVFHRDAYCYTPKDNAWRRVADAPRPVCAGMGAAFGSSHVLLFGGADGSMFGQDLRLDHPGFPKDILGYHTITDTWTRVGAMPEAPVTTVAVRWGDAVVLPSGEVHPGIRSPKIWRGVAAEAPGVGFGVVNYSVLGAYLAVLLAMGFYFSRREKTTEDFFLGGRRIPWWAAGLSIFGTQLSAITFLAIPFKVYATDWTYFLGNVCILLVAPLVVWVYLPFFRRLNVTTAYEYLERRFNVTVRLFGSTAYILLQLGRMGIVLFLPALALAAVTGIDVYVCILLMGVLCTVYTYLGGIEAVIWTDVLQVFVLIGGAVLSLVIIAGHVDGGLAGIVATGLENGKFHALNWTWDWTVPAVWVVVVGNLLGNLVPYTTDQTVVQRYLTTRDEKMAARSIWTNAILCIPASVLFFALGTALYVFYKTHPADLDPSMRADTVFPWFIVQQLPAGVSGLVIAGVFAAAMSSLDSSMNSVATVVTTDFYRRFKTGVSDAHCLKLARGITVILGVVGTGTAMLMAGFEIKSLWDTFIRVLGLFGGSLAGLFVLAVFTRRAHGSGALVGAVASAVVLFLVQRFTSLHVFLYAPVGIVSCAVVGYAASLLLPGPSGPMDGLTVYSFPARRNE